MIGTELVLDAVSKDNSAQSWEYLCVNVPLDSLNEYGSDGWELVCVIIGSCLIFKRPADRSVK